MFTYKCLKCGSQRDTANFFSVISGDRTRENIHKLEHRKSCTNMQRNFFTVKVTENWNRLHREVLDSPFLELYKTHLDTYLCSLLCRGGGLDSIPGVPFQPLQFCDSNPYSSAMTFQTNRVLLLYIL